MKTASATPLDLRGCSSKKIDKIKADWPIHLEPIEVAWRSKWTEICEILMLINANKLGLNSFLLGKPSIPTYCTLSVKLTLRFLPHPPCLNVNLDFKPISSILSFTTTFLQTGCMVERYTHTLAATETYYLIGTLTSN